RHGIAIISHIEVGDESQDALLLLHFFLFSGDLLRRDNCFHRGYRSCDPEPDPCQFEILAWLENDCGRVPVCESAGTDGDLVRYSRIDVVELEETVIVRLHALGIAERSAFERDPSAGDGATIHVGHRTDDRASLRFG